MNLRILPFSILFKLSRPMRIAAFYILLMLTAFTACKDDSGKIPREEFIPLLVDIHLLDGAIKQAKYRKSIRVPDSIEVYDYVLSKRGYTRSQFDSTLTYYSRNPREFERVYQEVLARLNRMETDAREEKQQKSKDTSGQDTSGKGS